MKNRIAKGYAAEIWFDHTHESGSVSTIYGCTFPSWEAAKAWVESTLAHLDRSDQPVKECISGWRIRPACQMISPKEDGEPEEIDMFDADKERYDQFRMRQLLPHKER